MLIVDVVSNAVKEVVAVGQSVSTVVKEEVGMYFENQKNTVGDAAHEARETIEKSKIYARFEDLEERVKETIETNFAKLNFSKSDEFEKMEKRIDSLENKLAKLLKNLETIRKEDTKK